MLEINVLQLKHIELATQEDKDNDLVYWAKLFMATTWEDIKELLKTHEELEEVADLILELNTDNVAKEALEGQRRYREQLASQYAAGVIDTQAKYETIIAEKKATIAAKDEVIANKDAVISELEKKFAKYEKNN